MADVRDDYSAWNDVPSQASNSAIASAIAPRSAPRLMTFAISSNATFPGCDHAVI